VNSASNTAFGGTISSTGTLVKAGSETFTLSAGYTNVADRTLRLEGGTLAVTGTLDIEEGAFELAGGLATADTLSSTGKTWDVTLSEGYEGQVLVDTTNSDVTDAQLSLSFAGGYDPDPYTTYTLVRASGSLTGAPQGGTVFGYTDNTLIGETGIRISRVVGTDSVLLTKVPFGTMFLVR
jgi:hypothetical protein